MTPRIECGLTGFATREKPRNAFPQTNGKATAKLHQLSQCDADANDSVLTIRTRAIIVPSLGINLGYNIRHSMEEVVLGECQR
jgi:hypothetical protein